ncbi:MAG: phosphatidate cytidylyltransferase [Anaeroplasmataceae bacterium]|nr:phosphatidate cytidylyltransferase [Anaeroplasmataceae bacterium]
MKKRVITGILLAIILIPLLIVRSLFPLLQCVITLFCVVATVEMIHMVEKTKPMKLGVKIIVIISTLLIYFGIVNEDPACKHSLIYKFMASFDFKLSILTTLTIACALVFACQIFVHDFDAADVGRCFMIILYISLGFSSITILLFNGLRFIIYMFLIAVLTDIFALVFGMNFGKHKMCPTISPKKTWEGAIGGTAVAVLVGSLFAIFYHYFGHFFVIGADVKPIHFFEGVFDLNKMPKVGLVFFIIFLSIMISIASQIGDLICSKFKRTYGIKDFSQVFPGHGGVLDRFDSTIFASIVFLCFLTIVRIAFDLPEFALWMGL